MTATAIQALIGTNTCSLASNLQCAVNWGNNKVFIQGQPPTGLATLARLSFLDGTEEASELLSTYNAQTAVAGIGIDANGDVYLPASAALYHGGLAKVGGSDLVLGSTVNYPSPKFGGSAIVNVVVGSTQYILDSNANGGITGQVMVSHNGSLDLSSNWAIAAGKAFLTPGKAASDKGFMLHMPTGGGAQLNLYQIDCSGTPTLSSSLGTVVPHDVNGAWSSIACNGICTDLTDGNILAVVYGQSGASQRSYLVKLDKANADVLWSIAVPGSGVTGIAGGGYMMSQSRIQNERFGLLIRADFSNGLRAIEVNTNTGTIVNTYTGGLDGVTPVSQQPQAYDDTLGGFICNVSFSASGDSPALLNSTPSSFNGWSVLYPGSTPATPTTATDDGWFDVIKPMRVD